MLADTPVLVIWVIQELGRDRGPHQNGRMLHKRLSTKATEHVTQGERSVGGSDTPPLCFKGSSDTGHTSKYFGSVDSSENNHKAKAKADGAESERFIKYVLQDPVWLLMADADDGVMMTYQMPSR